MGIFMRICPWANFRTMRYDGLRALFIASSLPNKNRLSIIEPIMIYAKNKKLLILIEQKRLRDEKSVAKPGNCDGTHFRRKKAMKLRDEARTGRESKQTLIHGLGVVRRSISCPVPFFSQRDFLAGVEPGKRVGPNFRSRTFMRPVYETRSSRKFGGKIVPRLKQTTRKNMNTGKEGHRFPRMKSRVF